MKEKSRRLSEALEKKLEEIAEMVEEGEIEEALKTIERLAQRGEVSMGEFHLMTGSLYLANGMPEEGLSHLKRAVALEPKKTKWLLLLVSAYSEMGMPVNALRMLRKFVQLNPNDPEIEQAKAFLTDLENDLRKYLSKFKVTLEQVEEALVAHENGKWEVEQGNYRKSIKLLEKAVTSFPNFPPILNNLALALFFEGEPARAIAIEERVLREIDNENVHALVNLVRFYLSYGRWDEANHYFERLKTQAHPHNPYWEKIAEGYALMGEDEELYQFLSLARFHYDELPPIALFWLGVAAANTGRQEMALRYWEEAEEAGYDEEQIEECLVALRQGKKGIGDAEKFSYFSPFDIAPQKAIKQFNRLFRRKEKLREEQYREGINRLISQYPSLVWALAQMLWEWEEKEIIITVLRELASPLALEALRRFAFSQAGRDDDRMTALLALVELGEIPEGQPVKMWLDGEWTETAPRRFEVTSDIQIPYSEEVQRMLSEATLLMKLGELKKAEQLFRQVLEIEPTAKEAYQNLAVLFNRRGDQETAEALVKKALEIDPLYVYPRCSLARFRILEGKLDEAEELLRPLTQLTRFHPQALSFYLSTLARLALEKGDYDQAIRHVEMGMKLNPDEEELFDLREEIITRTSKGKGKGRQK